MSDPQMIATAEEPRVPLWRRRWIFRVLSLVVAAALGVAAWSLARYLHPPQLQGAILSPPMQAYDFHLKDADGRIVSLSGFRGRAVALTFLYAHCPDVCPLIADNMRVTSERLRSLTGRVAFVAISVDPRGDTPAAIREFLKAHRVEGILTYLHASFADLRPVWAHYYVGSDAAEVNPEAVRASTPTPQQVGHTAIVYVIGPAGDIRAFLPGNFDPKDLETDLRLLSGEVR
jgi:protein SCO1